MNIAIEFRIDRLQANGTYNVRNFQNQNHGKHGIVIQVTGWLGFEWIPLESNGQQPFTAALINGTLSPQVFLSLPDAFLIFNVLLFQNMCIGSLQMFL